ncbi:unnamed protein product, partial [Darwinula stevensoni]
MKQMAAFVCNLSYEGVGKKAFLSRNANVCEEARKLFKIPKDKEVQLELLRGGIYSPLGSSDEIPDRGATIRVVAINKSDPKRYEEVLGLWEEATFIEVTEGLKIYEPRKRLTMIDEKNKLLVYHVGERMLPINSYGKVIILAGATGADRNTDKLPYERNHNLGNLVHFEGLSDATLLHIEGKTLLVSTMLNYLLGVNMEDVQRLRMVARGTEEWKSQTRDVTAYVINPRKENPRFKYPVTIVDTPGFGDTEGLDGNTFSMLKAFFDHKEGIDRLHSVGLVVPASTSRLTVGHTQVFKQIQGIFGKDVRGNILNEYWKRLQSLGGRNFHHLARPYGMVPHMGQLLSTEKSCSFSRQLFWEEMMMSMKKYFDILLDTEPVSTKMTYEVLQHREIIEKNIQELQEKVFE